MSAQMTGTTSKSGRDQSWRGKYLHALNIYTPKEMEPVRRRVDGRASQRPRVPKTRGDASDVAEIDGSMRSHHHQQQPTVATSAASMARARSFAAAAGGTNPYGFIMRPGLARARRCHTEPVRSQPRDRGSAPIQIPRSRSGSGSSERDAMATEAPPLDRRKRLDSSGHAASGEAPLGPGRLLSWEEPRAMQVAADAVTGGWAIPTPDGVPMVLGVPRGLPCEADGSDTFAGEDAAGEEEGEGEEDGGRQHDHLGDDIFKMDGLGDEEEEEDPASDQYTSLDAFPPRRRFRTVSLNVLSSGDGGKPPAYREYRRRSENDPHTHAQTPSMALSASFVPPHQMVQRDCFSIGLRDEFKRRTTTSKKII